MTGDISSLADVDLNTVPLAQSTKSVEGRLWVTLKLLAGTEANIHLFGTLKKIGLATNDVGHFVRKQTIHKKANKSVDSKLKKSAMQSKLGDACAYARRLRQTKNALKNKILDKYRNNRQEGKRVVTEFLQRYRVLKLASIERAEKKIQHLKEKDVLKKSFKVLPRNTSEILSGVNLFLSDQKEVTPEPLVGPFICDKSITFTENELKILTKGPKYLVRDELSKEDFKVEVEKMVAKKKIDNMVKDGNGEEDLSADNSSPCEQFVPNQTLKSAASIDSKHTGGGKPIYSEFNSKWEEWSGHMVYNEANKVLDFGNLQASRYKHNKELFLPQIEKPDSEAAHQTRRVELERVFDRISSSCSNIDRFAKNKLSTNPVNSSHKQNISESNLTSEELSGLSTLRKRIKDGSIVICETDKSKRFAALSPSQYIQSGEVHTQKDIEIGPEQIKRLQNHVNDHVWWFSKIMNTGTNWGHSDRMAKNVIDKGEQACHMQLLIKDHKNWSPESGTPPLPGLLFPVIQVLIAISQKCCHFCWNQ